MVLASMDAFILYVCTYNTCKGFSCLIVVVLQGPFLPGGTSTAFLMQHSANWKGTASLCSMVCPVGTLGLVGRVLHGACSS